MASDNEPMDAGALPAMNLAAESATGPTETGIQAGSPTSEAEVGIQAATPSPTQVQVGTGEPAGDESIPLKPRPRRRQVSPERLAAETRLLDYVLVGAVLVVAWLLGTFAIQNSDLWMHLATGRDLVQGDYHFGDNPYTHPETGRWVNHAWLFDVAVYEMAELAGGVDSEAGQALLVIFRSLIVILLAWVMLSIRRRGQSMWLPAVGTVLALLTLSTPLHFQPTLLSYLFLAVTLWLLNREPKVHPEETSQRQNASVWRAAGAWWWLPPLFILWVNVDAWFILGPLTVCLSLVGEALQRLFEGKSSLAARPGRLGALALVFGVGLAACLVNPYFHEAFTLPVEPSYLLVSVNDWLGGAIPLPDQFTAAGRAFQIFAQHDPRMLFHSPFEFGWHLDAFYGTGLTVAGIAYYVLLGAGLVSFVVRGFSPAWPWARSVLWLAFALASAGLDRLIPFFAVVAGPITALNFQDAVAHQLGLQFRTLGYWKPWSLGGRLATILGVLLLALAAWPGWLHRQWNQPDWPANHQVAWLVQTNPNLRQAAQQLHQARRAGHEGHAFNVDPQMAAYCAWFCPEEKTYFDYYRFPLFADRAATFIGVRRALAEPVTKPLWREVFRKEGIHHVILANQLLPYAQALTRFWLNAEEWVQPDVGEISTLFAWKDPDARKFRGAGQASWPRNLDLNALAFGPRPSMRAPDAGPREGVEPPASPWNPFAKRPFGSSSQLQTWNLCAMYFGVYSSEFPWVFDCASLPAQWLPAVGATGIGTGPTPGAATLSLMWRNLAILNLMGRNQIAPQLLVPDDHYVPDATPVLAVRAARRAVKEYPTDAEAYLALARAYRFLQQQEERWMRGQQPPATSFRDLDQALLAALREVQIVAALNQAVTLRPSLVEAHRLLRDVYARFHFADLSLHHQREVIRSLERWDHHPHQLPTQGSDAEMRKRKEDFRKTQEKYADALDQEKKDLKGLQAAVARRQKDYRLQAHDQNLQTKLRLALFDDYKENQRTDAKGRGLAEEALKLLLNARPGELDPNLAILQLKLLLVTGRIKEARDRLPDLVRLPADLQKQMEKQLSTLTAPQQKQFQQRAQLQVAMMEHQVTWLQTLLAAANGDYDEADRSLQSSQKRIQNLLPPRMLQARALRLLGDRIYAFQLGQHPFYRWEVMNISMQMNAMGVVMMLRSPAEQALLRGLLALEHGAIPTAAKLLGEAVQLTQDLRGQGMTYPERAIAVRYLDHIKKAAAKEKP